MNTYNHNIPLNRKIVFIVKGDVDIDSSVTEIAAGVIFGGQLSTGTTGAADNQLTLTGVFASIRPDRVTSPGGFNLQRDLDGAANNQAAETFVYDPKLLIEFSSNNLLGRSRIKWHEIAP